MLNSEKIAVLGLGYVGLPVAVAFARVFEGVVGFDISKRRVASLCDGKDWTGEISDAELASSSLQITDDPEILSGASFFVVTVPTPIDDDRRPDLRPLESACELVGKALSQGAIVVFESTVYPGVTEDFCGPLLETASGLISGKDFFLGYSPERINPGDTQRRLETITKIVSASDEAILGRVVAAYGAIIEAGLHIAPSIKVAEAAKVIENTQRDINIALMNEIALIFDKMGIRTKDVLEAAGTKWNFLPFSPGLVGGHCIGVDPYYLTSAAEKLGYHPEVILAGRRINDGMSAFIAQKVIKMLVNIGKSVNGARAGVLGLTFKENVPDLRNSKVPDVIRELSEYGVTSLVTDALANPDEALHEYDISLVPLDQLCDLDVLILAVNHDQYQANMRYILNEVAKPKIVIDVKSVIDRTLVPQDTLYWSL